MSAQRWVEMSFEDRARLIVGNFDLTEKQQDAVIEAWSDGEYDDTYEAREVALSDLQAIARKATLSTQQQDAEKARINRLVHKVMDK